MARRRRQTQDAPQRAAQYLRMSTEHQRYSTEHQAAAIGRYARRRGYEVVRSYVDSGVSGLSLKSRKALQQLLAEVVGGQAGFEVILVYDVSRWGRFQNPDQGAHYELLCQEAGVRVEYCAEPFENDGSMSSTILKGLKRAMAAEYSRELSEKVALAQDRLARKGFWQGGPAGYGLRRPSSSTTCRRGAVLETGQCKAVQGHHTILVPGPPDEVALVNRIYRLFVISGLRYRSIARLLNAEGAPGEGGAAWTVSRVRQLLTNPKYVGEIFSHKTSDRLRALRVRYPRSAWVRTRAAYKGVVSRKLFDAAQEAIRLRRIHMSGPAMLDALRGLLAEHGYIDEALVKSTPNIPTPQSFRKRFGGLHKAYDLIGYAGGKRPSPLARLSDAELLQRLAQLVRTHGRLSHGLINRTPDLPCADTVRRRLGAFADIYARLGVVRLTEAERGSPLGRARAEAMALRLDRLADGTPAPPG